MSTAKLPRKQLTIALVVSGAILVAAIAVAIFVFPRLGLQASVVWTTCLAGIGWLIKSNRDTRTEQRRVLASQKQALYFEFIDMLVGAMDANERQSGELFDKQTMRRWSLRLSMVGSDDVVRLWERAKSVGRPTETSSDPAELLRPWGELLVAMRKDCGHFDTSLLVSDLLGVFVNDIASYRDSVDRRHSPTERWTGHNARAKLWE